MACGHCFRLKHELSHLFGAFLVSLMIAASNELVLIVCALFVIEQPKAKKDYTI